MKRRCKFLLAATLLIGLMIFPCVSVSNTLSLSAGNVPPMAENKSYYIYLNRWGQGSVGKSVFEYYVFSKIDDQFIQRIYIENSVNALFVSDWRDIVEKPETYIAFEHLNFDFEEDIKVLWENKDGQSVYKVFLWDDAVNQFAEADYLFSGLFSPWMIVILAGGMILASGVTFVLIIRKRHSSKSET